MQSWDHRCPLHSRLTIHLTIQKTTQGEISFFPENKGAQADRQNEPNPTLVNAVIQGYQWREHLLNGRIASIKALARQEGIYTSYLMRVVRVGFLAPDIMEAILTGTQPADMTLEQFRRPIPLEWSKQRTLFGFASL